MKRKLPIGIQDFTCIREDGYLYVDKTAYIYDLVHSGKSYFLSRPRRFGKSLLISAMEAYWEGRKELFKGLDIEKLEASDATAWKKYPVFHFDFNGINYHTENALEQALDEHLRRWEEYYGITPTSDSLGERFRDLLISANKQTDQRCVILVDEYDKPLLSVFDNPELQLHNKELFKGFFSTLKRFDGYIKFVFITGVTKFHKVSIFSDLNQLNDISLNEEYSAICGITEEEIRNNFMPEVENLAKRQSLTVDECLEVLKRQYDGYRFNDSSPGIYNPFSLLKAFFDKRFGSYWYETGTPTFLVKKLRKENFDLRKLTDGSIYADESRLMDYIEDNFDPIPLLYQSGYLTIVDFDIHKSNYTLSFPNEEVKYGFIKSLISEYVSEYGSGYGTDIFTLGDYVESGQTEGIKNVLVSLFASIPYTTNDVSFEHYFQSVIYLIFTLLGKFTICEMHTFNGRIDCKVETGNYIYLFEFKRDVSADEALAQIEEKDYDLPFIADSREIIKIGAAFDSEKRILSDWKVLRN